MKGAGVITLALACGAVAGATGGGCLLPCNDPPQSFTRDGATYSSPALVPSFRLVLAPDLRTLTETFDLDGHSYQVVYTAQGEPSTSSFVLDLRNRVSATGSDGDTIYVDLPTIGRPGEPVYLHRL